MGTLRFQLPAGSSDDAIRELERAWVAGGYDNMPMKSHATVNDGILSILRGSDESGCLVAPFDHPGVGRLMGSSGTLLERSAAYRLSMELARGKIHQVRNQAADWKSVGMQISEGLEARLQSASRRFGHAVTRSVEEDIETAARLALADGYDCAAELVHDYVDQIFRARHSRQPKLDTLLGVRVNGSVPPTASLTLASAVNNVVLPIAWRTVEPSESNYRWESTDTALAWAERNNLRVSAGPLIDFSVRGLPDWLWLWEGDLQSIASFMCDFVETAVGRYRGRIRQWNLAAAGNLTSVLKLGEDDMLWLAARLAEAAWQVDSELEITVGIAQPWGDYLASEEHTYSPFIFADTLIRAGLKLAAVDVEWIVGVTPRGSYCRDMLDASRLLDFYAVLGVPLQVTLAHPASTADDSLADPGLAVAGGHWRTGPSADTQADWAETFTRLAVSKPFVRAVNWVQLSDGEEHQFPNCGLLDAASRPRPALTRLKQIRTDHLR